MPLPLTTAIIVALPALTFVLCTAGARVVRDRAGIVAVSALVAALGGSLVLVAAVINSHGAAVVQTTFPWAVVGERMLDFGFLVDGLSASTLAMVAVVATMVVTYAIGYMHGDARFTWFFAAISLFTMSMFGLVTAANLLQILLFWEIMGLCSYLLIGFWYEREDARAACIKAFITTRVGDMGILIGIILLFIRYNTLDLHALFRAAEEAPDHLFLTVACLLLFVGAVGKSAQFPLYFWLPHAMAGPTPVSGLLHSATMVAAGVFLVARTYPLFEAAHYALPLVAAAGMFSALFGALLALTETDIKRTLAYSTMSQLGYMMGALGAGGLVAGVFHLITHGFFKSLLFLAAGSVIHGIGTQDVREMGGLWKSMRTTAITFLIGALALAGVPPLAGFFSKDAILVSLWEPTLMPVWEGRLLFLVALATAVLTAFYMFRLYFMVFMGEPRTKAHAHESPRVMTAPLGALSFTTVLGGGINLPGLAILAFLVAPGEHESVIWWVMVLSIAAATGGVYMAWSQHKERLGAVYGLERYVVYDKGHYLERIYGAAFIRPVFTLSEFLRSLNFDRIISEFVVKPVFWISDSMRAADIDRVWMGIFAGGTEKVAGGMAAMDGGLDGAVNALGSAGIGVARAFDRVDTGGVDRTVDSVGTATVAVGKRLRKLQTGLVANYALFMLGLGILIFYLAIIFTRGQS